MGKPKQERARSGAGQRLGDERHALIRAAFVRAQAAIRAGYYIEAISILDSIAADRLGSLLHGIIRQRIELEATIGNLMHGWENPPKVRSQRGHNAAPVAAPVVKELPADIANFLKSDLTHWTKGRNKAVHGMAKLQRKDDLSFDERYAELESVALEGVRVLLRLDELDCREKAAKGKLAATEPGALDLDEDLRERTYGPGAPAS